MGFSISCFITETAQKRDIVDECFNLLMTMWSWDGSMRIRYGEYGVNWVEAEEGAVSDMGYPAKIKILDDPFGKPCSMMADFSKIADTVEAALTGRQLQPMLLGQNT